MEKDLTNGRLMSLDALRGFDMLMIMGFGAVCTSILHLCGCTDNAWLVLQFKHVAWHGLRFEDTIFPLFLFIAGVSFPFSYEKRKASGVRNGCFVIVILRRALVLFLLGLVYNGLLTCDFDNLVWGSVLGRIGLSWAIAALVYVFCGWKLRLGFAVVVLLGYWLCTFLLHASDYPTADVLSPQGNFACYLDRLLLPGKLTEKGLLTNQGIVGTVSASVTALLGMAAGDLLRSAKYSSLRKVAILLSAAIVLLLLGLGMAYGCGRWSFPINKKLWSSSFVLVLGCYSTTLLAFFYWVIDVCGWRKGVLFFRVIGLNAITIYLVRRFVSLDALSRAFLGGVASFLPKDWQTLVIAIGSVALGWLLLYFLHCHKCYLKT